MSKKELPQLSDQALADLDGDGTISQTEWDAWLAKLNLGKTATQILELVRDNAHQMKDQASSIIAIVDNTIATINDSEIEILSDAIHHLGFDASSLHVRDSLWRSVVNQHGQSSQILPTFPMQ